MNAYYTLYECMLRMYFLVNMNFNVNFVRNRFEIEVNRIYPMQLMGYSYIFFFYSIFNLPLMSGTVYTKSWNSIFTDGQCGKYFNPRVPSNCRWSLSTLISSDEYCIVFVYNLHTHTNARNYYTTLKFLFIYAITLLIYSREKNRKEILVTW